MLNIHVARFIKVITGSIIVRGSLNRNVTPTLPRFSKKEISSFRFASREHRETMMLDVILRLTDAVSLSPLRFFFEKNSHRKSISRKYQAWNKIFLIFLEYRKCRKI